MKKFFIILTWVLLPCQFVLTYYGLFTGNLLIAAFNTLFVVLGMVNLIIFHSID